jgi:hypothetical protein
MIPPDTDQDQSAMADQLQADQADWKQRPFSSDLDDLLLGRNQSDRRCHTILTMLRAEDVPAIVDWAKEPDEKRWVCYWLSQSGLFTEARRLASESDPRERGSPVSHPRSSLAIWDLWGNSDSMLEYMGRLDEIAPMIPDEYPAINLWLGGPNGPEKARAARAIHDNARRGVFSVIAPECQDPLEAVRAAATGGTVFLSRCDDLPVELHVAIRQAMVERRIGITPMDTLLIVDTEGEQDGGSGLWGSLKKGIPVNWSFARLPRLGTRSDDIPLLVNKTLERIGADDLVDVRHHIADGLRAAHAEAEDQGEVGWLEHSFAEMCGVLCPDWTAPVEESPAVQAIVESASECDAFSNNSDYSSVKYRGQEFLFKGDAPMVVRILHEASQTEHPDVHKDSIAAELNRDVKDFRVRDVFNDVAYETLVESDGKGFYKLKIAAP